MCEGFWLVEAPPSPKDQDQEVTAPPDRSLKPTARGALPEVGEDWLSENPYRDAGEEVWQTAVQIGASGYNQNCARCHGLEAISGGLAPDLRFLEAEEYGDEWYMERFIHGYTQNGTTKMPAFGELLGQKAAWAIRTYIEARPDDAAIEDQSAELKDIRDQLAAGDADVEALKARLREIAASKQTHLERLFLDWCDLAPDARPDFLTYAHHRRNPELEA